MLKVMLISYLTWIIAFTGPTANGIRREPIPTRSSQCTVNHWTFNCVKDTATQTYQSTSFNGVSSGSEVSQPEMNKIR